MASKCTKCGDGGAGRFTHLCQVCYRHQHYLDHKAEQYARHREWVRENEDKTKKYRAEYYQQNREREDALNKRWKAKHPVDVRAIELRSYFKTKDIRLVENYVKYHTDAQYKRQHQQRYKRYCERNPEAKRKSGRDYYHRNRLVCILKSQVYQTIRKLSRGE